MYQLILYNTDTMEKREKASIIRKQINQLKIGRAKLEEKLLKSWRMVRACLVKRHLGTSHKKRRKPYWYLSWVVEGKTVLKYVKMEQLDKISRQTQTWKEFSAALSQWVKVNRQIEKLLRQLGRIQSEGYDEKQAKE